MEWIPFGLLVGALVTCHIVIVLQQQRIKRIEQVIKQLHEQRSEPK